MARPLPVVRSLYLPGVWPQLLAIAALTVVAHAAVTSLSWNISVAAGALVYYIACRIARRLFLRTFTLGIDAYQSRRFSEASGYMRETIEALSRRPLLDKYRSFLFGIASRTSLMSLARSNLAYCEAMLGNREGAEKLFTEVLELDPENANAEAGLRMLRSGQAKGEVSAT